MADYTRQNEPCRICSLNLARAVSALSEKNKLGYAAGTRYIPEETGFIAVPIPTAVDQLRIRSVRTFVAEEKFMTPERFEHSLLLTCPAMIFV